MEIDDDDFKELQERFKFVCKKCNSENVKVDITEGINYGGMTGWQPGSITIGCNRCKDNDLYISTGG